MSKFKVSEMFYSLQGEGRYVGVPSVFMRTFGCNLKCEGFGMASGEKSEERFDARFDDLKRYQNMSELPLVATGCDSYASWDTRFKGLAKDYDDKELAQSLTQLVPKQRWESTEWNTIHLVITGGEPLLGWQKAYPALFDRPELDDLKNITFETNGTKPLTDTFKKYLHDSDKRFTFAVSPKLSASGEDIVKTVQPEVVYEYEQHSRHSFFKFVCNTAVQVTEVKKIMDRYRNAGCMGPVYIMPTGGMMEEYEKNAAYIASLCLQHRFRFSPRLHINLWGNKWGT